MCVTIPRWWLCSVLPLAAFLLCAASGSVDAHTHLLGSDPVNQAVLSSPPVFVRLWFSAALDPAFSTAIVENAAHTYVNDRDAQLAPGNAREMDIHLQSHLAAGVYAVVWRAVSDGDGRVLSGVVFFAISRPDGTVPGVTLPLAQRWPGQFDVLALITLILMALVMGGIGSLAGIKHLRGSRAWLRWGSLVGMGIVISFGLGPGVEVSRMTTNSSPPSALTLEQPGMGQLDSFHTTLTTTDQRYLIVLDVNTDITGESAFAASVEKTVTGKPLLNGAVFLLTTMLDMSMGTDRVPMYAAGQGRFTARSNLSMGGLWLISIQLHTSDHQLHQASVKMLTPF